MSMFRNTIWFIKGLSEYTKQGFLTASKSFNPSDLDVDCSVKAYMVTGANSGIGKQAALEIARRGGTVHLVCRNPETAEKAKEEIINETSNDKIFVHILDLSNIRAIHEFADKFVQEHSSLNVLINNAGCMVNTREVTSEGNEKNFATNTLGTHVLTIKLIPLLQKVHDPRVIIVSSGGMLTNKLNLNDLHFEKKTPFDGTMAYAQNKRQQVIMTEQYSKKYPSIFFASMHPGWADTPAVRSSMPDFYNKMKDRLRTVEQGADTIVWLAVAKEASENPAYGGGLFFQDRKPVAKHLPLACTKSSAEDDEKLMAILDEMSKKFESK